MNDDTSTGMVRATTSFRAPGLTVNAGDVLPADHPVVAGREHVFELVRDGDEEGSLDAPR